MFHFNYQEAPKDLEATRGGLYARLYEQQFGASEVRR